MAACGVRQARHDRSYASLVRLLRRVGVGSVNGVLFANVRILPESCPPPLSAILPMPRVFRDLAYETDK